METTTEPVVKETVEFGVFPQLQCTAEIREELKTKRVKPTWIAEVYEEKRKQRFLDEYTSEEKLISEFTKPAAKKSRAEMTAEDVLRRWPALTAHLICGSLGYATPDCAARIILDAAQGKENWCEWIDSCYKRNPMPAVKTAIKYRHTHKGYMAEFKTALMLVCREILGWENSKFASWF